MTWEKVMGLEVHLQLSTQSKIFSSSATAFGADANTQTNPLDVALPGTLPVLNHAAVSQAIVFGLGVGAEIGKVPIAFKDLPDWWRCPCCGPPW